MEDAFRNLIMEQGLEVGVNTIVCELWHEQGHKNCVGCSSELGCGKLVKIKLLSMTHLMYKPRDFNDFRLMQEQINSLIKQVLEVKTVEELKKIPNI